MDRKFNIPKLWFRPEYAERRKQCKLLEDIEFQTKDEMALDMIK